MVLQSRENSLKRLIPIDQTRRPTFADAAASANVSMQSILDIYVIVTITVEKTAREFSPIFVQMRHSYLWQCNILQLQTM